MSDEWQFGDAVHHADTRTHAQHNIYNNTSQIALKKKKNRDHQIEEAKPKLRLWKNFHHVMSMLYAVSVQFEFVKRKNKGNIVVDAYDVCSLSPNNSSIRHRV